MNPFGVALRILLTLFMLKVFTGFWGCFIFLVLFCLLGMIAEALGISDNDGRTGGH